MSIGHKRSLCYCVITSYGTFEKRFSGLIWGIGAYISFLVLYLLMEEVSVGRFLDLAYTLSRILPPYGTVASNPIIPIEPDTLN